MVETQTEREDKYDVDGTFVLPALSEVLSPGQRTDGTTLHLSSTYYDTDQGDLSRQQVTFRLRTGDDDTGWHVKLPAGEARTELRMPVSDEIPAELLEATAGLRRGRPLIPTAVLHTERRLVRLLAQDRSVLAEIADDHVTSSTFGSDTTGRSWREVEVELGTGTAKTLKRVGRLLTDAGATPSPHASKLQRALHGEPPTGLIAREENPLRRPDHPGGTVADLVYAYFRTQRAAILAGDVALRRGENEIHATRVATRRLRSTLKVFAADLDAELAEQLDTELSWYAGQLGAVRDLDVLTAHLLTEVATLPPELVLGPVAARIEGYLGVERVDAFAVLQEAMASQRYFALLDMLQAWQDAPPFVTPSIRPAADAADELRSAQRTVLKRLTKAHRLVDAGSADADEALHRARKAAKRARYAAELLIPVQGKKAARAARDFRELQDELGEHQDARLAQDVLRRLGAQAGTAPGENGFTFGLLYAQELARSLAHRA